MSPSTSTGRSSWGIRRSQRALRIARRPAFIALAAVAALVATGLATQPKHTSTRAEFASGTAWLPSDVPGQLTLLDGSTGMISGQLDSSALAGVKPGDQLDVVQDGSGAYMVDGQQGVVARVDGATRLVTATSSVVGPDASNVSLYVGKRFVYVVDPAKRRVSALNATDLRATGQPVEVSPVAAVVDSRGHLWVVDGATRRLIELDGAIAHRRRLPLAEGNRVALVSVSGHPALVDYEASPPSVQIVESGSLGRAGCLGTTPDDGSAVTAGSSSNHLWTASGMTGTLHESYLANGRCSAETSLGSRASAYGPPVEADGEVFVANEQTGQVAIVDPATSHLVGQPVQAVTSGSHFDLFVKDGFVFFNDPDSPQAGVIRPDGTVVHIDKYTTRSPKSIRVSNPVAGNKGTPHKDPNARNNGASGRVFPLPVPGSRPAFSSRGATSSGFHVTTSILPPAFVGRPYSAALSAIGGTRPYTWFVSGIPPGFELDASSGVISGTASTPGDYSMNVTVTDFTGASAGLTLPLDVYLLSTSPPQVTALSPHSGSARGGTVVTITGLHLAGETSVRFGGGTASMVTVVSDSTLEATAPPGVAGSTVDVTVTTPAGVTGPQVSDRYTYMPPGQPVVTGLSEQEGLTAGGALLLISGSGFYGATSVDFGQVPAASFEVVSDAVLSVITPVAAAGMVDVTVVSVRGRSSTTTADRYTFVPGLTNAHEPESTGFVDYTNDPGRIAIDPVHGYVFVSIGATKSNGNIVLRRSLGSDGQFRIYAGTKGASGYSGDGYQAVNATLDDPTGLAVDARGDLFIADYNNHVIREVAPDGIITTVAGRHRDRGSGISGIGHQATQADIGTPFGLTFGPGGDLYFSSLYQDAVFRISAPGGAIGPNSTIDFYAGKPNQNLEPDPNKLGDGQRAVDAALKSPEGLAFDSAGDLFIADWGDGRVRMVTPPSQGQIITTVAGGGGSAVQVAPQLARSVQLKGPNDVAADPFGNVYVSEDVDHAEVDILTTRGYISTVVAGEAGSLYRPKEGTPEDEAEGTLLMDLGGIAFVPSDVLDTPAGGTLYVWDPRAGVVRIFS